MKALCVGYCYDGMDDRLSATYIDLWTACEYLHQKGFYCYIIDDCVDLLYVNKIYVERSLPITFLNFYLVKKCDWFERTSYQSKQLKRGLADADSLFFYYTGHLKYDGSFKFANNNYPMRSVFSYLSEILSIDCQVFAVIDGCYSGNHPFSHVLVRDKLQLTNYSFPMRQECIYLHASAFDEKAASSSFQSYFTKYFFRELMETTASISVLIEKIQGRLNYRCGGKAQSLGVATSLALPLILWPWVFGLNFHFNQEYVMFIR